MELKEYSKTSNKLKKELEFASKDQDRFFHSCRSALREELEEVDDYSKELTQKYDHSRRALFVSMTRLKKQVEEVKNRLSGLISSTKSQGVGADYDFLISSLQKSSDLVNSEIVSFKETCRVEFEDLSQSEKLLENELEYYAQKFAQWESEVPRIQKASFKSIKEEKDLPPLKQDLQRIEKEIQEFGGQYLGWDETDHTEFLKVWNRFKGKATPAFFSAATNALPLHEMQDIQDHSARYANFLSLNEKKKEVLQKWKDEKAKQSEPAEVPEVPVRRARPQSAVIAKQKLEEWKVNREKLKEEENERKKAEDEKKREAELKKKMQVEEKRQKVLEYKEMKEIEKAKNNLISDYLKRKDKVELSEEDKVRMKQREDKLVEQKRARTIANMKSLQDKEKTETLNKLKSQAQWAHVDSKLEQETFAVKARKEATTNPSENRPQTFGGILVHRPTRAVPSWRVGL